jgi:hypothetical protein
VFEEVAQVEVAVVVCVRLGWHLWDEGWKRWRLGGEVLKYSKLVEDCSGYGNWYTFARLWWQTPDGTGGGGCGVLAGNHRERAVLSRNVELSLNMITRQEDRKYESDVIDFNLRRIRNNSNAE